MNNHNYDIEFKDGVLYGSYIYGVRNYPADDGSPVFHEQVKATGLDDRLAKKRLTTLIVKAIDHYVEFEKNDKAIKFKGGKKVKVNK